MGEWKLFGLEIPFVNLKFYSIYRSVNVSECFRCMKKRDPHDEDRKTQVRIQMEYENTILSPRSKKFISQDCCLFVE